MSESKKSRVVGSQISSESGPSSRRYSEEFKGDAVRLVTDEKYSFLAAAKAVGVTVQSLREWHRKFVPSPPPCDENASQQELQDENKRLRQQLRRAELERDILKKATAYFAKESL